MAIQYVLKYEIFILITTACVFSGMIFKKVEKVYMNGGLSKKMISPCWSLYDWVH